MLTVTEVRVRYGDLEALRGVGLDVQEGQFVSVIGPNGAGKSTLVNVLTGLVRPSSGAVRFKGEDVAGSSPKRLIRLGMARSFQLVAVFPQLTLLECLQAAVVSRLGRGKHLFRSLRGEKDVEENAREVAALFGLEKKCDRLAGELAQGEKKLLDVASAFALYPELILLDEPTSGVSTAEKHDIMETLMEASRRVGVKSVIQVDHDMDIVFSYSDRVIAMHEGRVLAHDTAAAVRSNDPVMDTVAGRTRR